VCMHETQHDVVEGVAHVGGPAFLLVRVVTVMEPCTCRPAGAWLAWSANGRGAQELAASLLAAALDGRVHITAVGRWEADADDGHVCESKNSSS